MKELDILKEILLGVQTLTYIGGLSVGISLVFLIAKNWGRNV
jgi:hypothetical protein